MAEQQTTSFTPKTVTVSGTTYTAAKLADFPLLPVNSRTIGGLGGMQYEYYLGDSTVYWDFVDHLTRAACDVADEDGDHSYRMIAIYKDLEKI